MNKQLLFQTIAVSYIDQERNSMSNVQQLFHTLLGPYTYQQ